MVCTHYTQATSFFSIIPVGLFLSTNSEEDYLVPFSYTITEVRGDLITSRGHMANKRGDSNPGCLTSVSFRDNVFASFPSLHKKQSSISVHDYDTPQPACRATVLQPVTIAVPITATVFRSQERKPLGISGISSATQMILESVGTAFKE